MTELSTLPQEVNITHYAGDTLIIHITIATEAVAGRTFFAQVRTERHSRNIAATFQVAPTASGADITLLSADSLALAEREDFSGFWDVQLAEADGGDPVTTLAFGEMNLFSDVTRTP